MESWQMVIDSKKVVLPLLLTVLFLGLGSTYGRAQDAKEALWQTARSCSVASDFQQVWALHAKLAYEPDVQRALSAAMNRSGRRRFDGDGGRGDAILNAAARPDGFLAFTYRRNGKRVGLAIGYANTVGSYWIYSGWWYQQSKLDSRVLPQPSVMDDFERIANSWGHHDEGGFTYFFDTSSGRIVPNLGHGLCWEDTYANDNWISF